MPYSWWLEFQGAYAYVRASNRTNGFTVRCVQAFARNLFRDEFFPVCGDPALFDRSADACWFCRLFLVIDVLGYELVFLVHWHLFCVPGADIPFERFQLALCPRNYMGRFSSRLRVSGTIRRERRSTLVRMAIVGCLPFPGRLLRICFLMLRVRMCVAIVVPAASVCVVTKNLHGICFGMIFFPPAGYRFSTSGTLAVVGSEGHVWSSLLSGTSSCRLAFRSVGVGSDGVVRAYGFILRCVQEITWGGFLPVCGVPEQYGGNAGEYRFQWLCLGRYYFVAECSGPVF